MHTLRTQGHSQDTAIATLNDVINLGGERQQNITDQDSQPQSHLQVMEFFTEYLMLLWLGHIIALRAHFWCP